MTGTEVLLLSQALDRLQLARRGTWVFSSKDAACITRWSTQLLYSGMRFYKSTILSNYLKVLVKHKNIQEKVAISTFNISVRQLAALGLQFFAPFFLWLRTGHRWPWPLYLSIASAWRIRRRPWRRSSFATTWYQDPGRQGIFGPRCLGLNLNMASWRYVWCGRRGITLVELMTVMSRFQDTKLVQLYLISHAGSCRWWGLGHAAMLFSGDLQCLFCNFQPHKVWLV